MTIRQTPSGFDYEISSTVTLQYRKTYYTFDRYIETEPKWFLFNSASHQTKEISGQEAAGLIAKNAKHCAAKVA